MPELPEVETIKNELAPSVVGHSLTGVAIFDEKLVAVGSLEEVHRELIGRKIESLKRRGKYLIFELSSGRSLIMHLRMTGSLLLNPREVDRYARAVFDISGEHRVVFSDRRRLGRIWLVNDADTTVGKLGPEPFDEGYSAEILGQSLSRHRIPVKSVLLDQHIVAGIGNMYADEALFAAGIHPSRRAHSLSRKEVRTLHNCIRAVLEAAINCKGASVDTYVRPEGELGTAHCDFKVAHRRGQPCPACGATIQWIKIQNRGSCFCPKCQSLSSRHTAKGSQRASHSLHNVT
ncbi:MAG: bifunctional DNA-formamidopyrimidine glycosylase/DNA-(apurinic or apyrimidinic site) lyase [Dehalococcoidia bacterium]|nr:bifunctional DNA-formamidopyrimidine glycosylase/DNA-(apurinic or apyrimidinic site) lyase [Dehalococcoidia bacterium]